MSEVRRYQRHGKWVGLFSAFSFISLFAIGYGFEIRIYNKLVRYCGMVKWQQELACAGDSSKSLIVLINNEASFVKLSLCRSLLCGIAILILAGAIGLLISRWWSSGKFLIPIVLYAAIPLFVSPDPIGIKLVAFFYAALIYIMRFAMRFNPHLEIKETYKKEVLPSIFQMYHQYAILSLAVIGLTLTTFLFGFETTFRDFWQPAWTNFAAIRMPFYASHAAFLGVGLVGLTLGVCREFHVKQEEVLDAILMNR